MQNYSDKFHYVSDSNGVNMIKDVKRNFFQILMKYDLDSLYVKSWTNMAQYISQNGDTAFISIPMDSVMKFSDQKVRWKSGYRLIFYKGNADTTYTIGGTCSLIDRRKKHKT
jgi:hypothetical protein